MLFLSIKEMRKSGENRGGERNGGIKEGKERRGGNITCVKSAHDDMSHYMIPCDPWWSPPLNRNHLLLTFRVEESISAQCRLVGIKRVLGSGLWPSRTGMDHNFQSSEPRDQRETS